MVIHYGGPKSLDDYFQESGMGGRSGQQAHLVNKHDQLFTGSQLIAHYIKICPKLKTMK